MSTTREEMRRILSLPGRRRIAEVGRRYGVTIPTEPVCEGHDPPASWSARMAFAPPPVMLVLGSRGSGKSFLTGFATHLESEGRPRLGTTILGGSEAQSLQIYESLKHFDVAWGVDGEQHRPFARFNTEKAVYTNGSHVSYLPASDKSVRGPHEPRLRHDEIDEMKADIREAAMGMLVRRHGVEPSVTMTSTWHRVGGEMEQLLARGREGAFPTYVTCAFDVLERCPEERSGKQLQNCPECPIFAYCHEDVEKFGLPRAKRSDGHYSIAALIQKALVLSKRAFLAEFLCGGPRVDGVWFPGFDEQVHVSEDAEYQPRWGGTILGLDTGVVTGGVFVQIKRIGGLDHVHAFADLLTEGALPAANTEKLKDLAQTFAQGRIGTGWTDPIGGARNPISRPLVDLYAELGMDLIPWPKTQVVDGLRLIEGLLNPAAGPPRLKIHPRCVNLIRAFKSYRRAKRLGQFVDVPEDPQHPAEDMIDALRGALVGELAGGVEVGSDPYQGWRG